MNGSQLNKQYNTMSHRPSPFVNSSQRYICGRSYCYHLSINTIQYRIDLLLLSIGHRDIFAGDHTAINYLSMQYNIA